MKPLANELTTQINRLDRMIHIWADLNIKPLDEFQYSLWLQLLVQLNDALAFSLILMDARTDEADLD